MPDEDTYPTLKHFSFEHLPVELQRYSKPCAVLAVTFARDLPPGPEVSAGLRHLMEAKDCFVRAALE